MNYYYAYTHSLAVVQIFLYLIVFVMFIFSFISSIFTGVRCIMMLSDYGVTIYTLCILPCSKPYILISLNEFIL